jgi:multidrug efflux pump subunit AcrB
MNWGKAYWKAMTFMALFYFFLGISGLTLALLFVCKDCGLVYQSAFLTLLGVVMMNSIGLKLVSDRLKGIQDEHNRKNKAM